MRAVEDQLFVTWRRAGSADALAQVYDRTAPALLRVALHLVRVPATAEDLVQATFLAAIERAEGYDATRPLLGWLVGILHNQAKWLMRREGRAVDASRLGGREPADPLDGAAAAEFTMQVDEAIEALPEVYRPVLRLHLKHQLPAAEIAHALDRPAGTVRSQVVRGLELLRAALPAGVALGVAFAALLPQRGLAAVREVVLAHGAKTAAAAGAAGAGTVAAAPVVAAGVLTMKKFAMVVVLAALLLALRSMLGVTPEGTPAAGGDAAEPAVVVAHPGEVRREASPDPATRIDRVPVPAPSSKWRLTGNVTFDEGPFAGADVKVTVMGPWGNRPELLATGRSDERGDYVVDLGDLRDWAPIDRDRALLYVAADADGHVGRRGPSELIELPHRDVTLPLELHRDLELVPGCTVTGRVLDETGHPVAGSALHLWRAAELIGYYTLTEDDGSFRIGVSEVGDFTVRAEHDRFGQVDAPVTCGPGAVVELGDLTMRAAALLRFRVVFEDGQPAAGIELWVGDYVSRADDNGRFVVARATPGELQVRSDEQLLATIAPGDPEHEVVLHGKHLVVPSYVDESGAELRSIGLQWRRYGEEHDAALVAFAAGGDLPDSIAGRAGRGGIGRVGQLLVDRGDWLWVRASHGDAHGEALVHAVPPQNVLRPVIRMVERRRDATLRLSLRCDDGGPVDKLHVWVEQLRLGEPGTTLHVQPAEAAEDGLVLRCFPGRYRLHVAARGLDPDRVPRLLGSIRPIERIVELTAGAEVRVESVVATGGRVRIDVHAPGMQAGQDLALTIRSPSTGESPDGESSSFVREGDQGWTVVSSALAETPLLWLPLLPPGRHLLTLRAPGYAETCIAVDIRPRLVTDLDVWLTKQ